jgi:DnaJ-class molecular chaperone
MINKEKCKSCKGSGRQVFHGAFESGMGDCNFCGGSGKYEDYSAWFKENMGELIHSSRKTRG